MADIVDKLPILQTFIKSLTWKNISQFSVFLLVIGLAYATYDNKESVYNYVNQKKLERSNLISSLSRQSEVELDEVVKKSELIVAIQITVVDFQRNVRTVIYTSTDNVEMSNLYAAYINNTVAPELPLFNNDQVNNKRTVDLINGEFNCLKYVDTLAYRYLPGIGQYVDTVCGTGIPPFYGRFTGIVTLYLARAPSAEEVDQLRVVSKKYSAIIYDRDMR